LLACARNDRAEVATVIQTATYTVIQTATCTVIQCATSTVIPGLTRDPLPIVIRELLASARNVPDVSATNSGQRNNPDGKHREHQQ
jgi:hypothetical protein